MSSNNQYLKLICEVWLSYGQFELSSGGGEERVREVYKEAHDKMKEEDLKEERVAILHAWKLFEVTRNFI